MAGILSKRAQALPAIANRREAKAGLRVKRQVGSWQRAVGSWQRAVGSWHPIS